MRSKILLLSFLSTLATTSCIHPHSANRLARQPAQADGTGRLGNITNEDVKEFKDRRTQVLFKFVVFPDPSGHWKRLEMIDPRIHSFHYEYLASKSQFKNFTFEQVEALSFPKANRKVLLGVMQPLMAVAEGHWDPKMLFGLTTEEAPDPSLLRSIKESLQNWVKQNAAEVSLLELGGTYTFQPNPNQEAEVKAKIADYGKHGIPVSFQSISQNQDIYNAGWGMGKIQILPTQEDVDAALQKGQLTADSILVTAAHLRELPPVAGVISAVPLTEASHMVLLAQMYGIPMVYEPKATERRKANQGQWAFIQSTLGVEKSFEVLSPLNEEDKAYLKSIRPQRSLQPAIDLKTQKIVEVASLSANATAAYGGKATNFGLIRRTIPDNTRKKVIAIPIGYYFQFLSLAKVGGGKSLRQVLEEKLKTLSGNPSYLEVDSAMKEIREQMKLAVLPKSFIENLRSELRKHFPGSGVRLKVRSSSNVEDGAEFNGAGLYESEGVCLFSCPKGDDFAEGLVKVWSSLYTTRGFWARLQFKVPEAQVGMGLVVHEPYKGELANGVVRFKKIINDGEPPSSQAEILGVPGEELSITNANEGGLNEKVVLRDGKIIEERLLKNANFGRKMMTDGQYNELARLMAELYDKWPYPLKELEIESEWKLTSNKTLEIKQVRIVPEPVNSVPMNGQYKVLTGGVLKLQGVPTKAAWEMPWKPEKIQFEVPSFTRQEFENGKVRFLRGEIQIQGRKFPLRIGNQAIMKSKYETKLHVALDADQLPPMTFEIRIPTALPLSHLTQFSSSLSAAFHFSLGKLGNAQFQALPSPSAAEMVRENEKPLQYDFTMKSCPIQVQGQSGKRWAIHDEEFRVFDAIEVKGLLPRPMNLSPSPANSYHLQQHESLEDIWLDLLSDPKLQAEERQILNQNFGRFLQIEERSNRLRFWNEQLNQFKSVPGCPSGGFHSEEVEGGDDEGGTKPPKEPEGVG